MSSISSHQKNVITVQFKPILLFDRNLFVLNQSHELNLKITYIGHFSLIWGFFFPSLAALQFRAGKVFFLFEVFTLQKSDITKVRGLDYTTLFAMELDVREWITRKKPESPQTPNKYFFQRYKQQKWTKKKLLSWQVFKNHNIMIAIRYNLLPLFLSVPPFVYGLLVCSLN